MFSKHIFILLLFFTIVFIISELWNWIDKYTSNFTVGKLSIKDLQFILRYRGIRYKGALEKKELINLIEETGQTDQYEWSSAKSYIENVGKCNLTSISVIPNEDLFNELVEDSKDSAWILMTILPKSSVFFSDEYNGKLEQVWCHVQSIYAKYGFNMAVLDCENLYNLCWNRGFHRSPFVLVLPRGRVKIKDSVDFFVFPYSIDVVKESVESLKKSVIDWLRKKMAHRVNQESAAIMSSSLSPDRKSLQTMNNNNNHNNHNNNNNDNFPVHFVSVYSNRSGMAQMPPTSISAHSVKFTGRIHFWSGTLDDIPASFIDKIRQNYRQWQPPGHFFINSNDLIYQYGTKDGQSISYDSLQLFFRDLCPGSNDIFMWNLLIINLIISFQVAMQNGSIALRLGYFIWYFLVFNILYGLVFISLLSSLNLSRHFDGFLRLVSIIWQKIAISALFEHLRYLQLSNKLNLSLFSLVWLIIFVIVVLKLKNRESNSETRENDISPPNSRLIEPWDPEAGHQIALLSSLGSFSLTLQQRPPLYLSKLLMWSFRAPKKWAFNLANKCKDSKVAATIGTLCDVNKPSGHDDSDISSDFSSGDVNYSTLTSESQNELLWPKGYIFTKRCCICLDRFRQNEMLCGLPCGHAFHDSCIKKWLVQRAKDDCPQCRWPVYKEKP